MAGGVTLRWPHKELRDMRNEIVEKIDDLHGAMISDHEDRITALETR